MMEQEKREKRIEEAEPKVWAVPVQYIRYGTISVAAPSAAEAYDMVAANPEAFDFPDEDFYLEGSYSVADDDRESAIATIEDLGGY